MPGRLLGSFRSGNLAEHLGVLLLKGVAAIAEVARPEDVGLDAVATLLRPDADRCLYAEDGFVVQLKSESVNELEYSDHELKWLTGQAQPMFIGRVSLKDFRISLYPTLHVNQAVLSLHAECVVVHFGRSDLPPFFCGEKHSSWSGREPAFADVWLGEPLLQWSIGDLNDGIFLGNVYRIFKRFLELARHEHQLIKLGQFSSLSWSTNDESSIRSEFAAMKCNPDEFSLLATQAEPILRSILVQAYSRPVDECQSITMAILAIIVSLKQAGANIDASGLLEKMASQVLRARASQDSGPTTETPGTGSQPFTPN